jgi:hypothetical protein
VRANANGLTNHAACSTASGLIYGSKFERQDQKLFDCFMELMKDLFGLRTTQDKPNVNLAGLASLTIDRGYTSRVKLLAWRLSCGGALLGTMKVNTAFLPFNSTKASSGSKKRKAREALDEEEEEEEYELEKQEKMSSRRDKDKPIQISAKSFHTAYSATVAYRSTTASSSTRKKKAKKSNTSSGPRDQFLSCTAFANGVSSSVPLLMSSRKQRVLEWDLVGADPTKSAKYNESLGDEDSANDLFMMAFKLLYGKDPAHGVWFRSDV